LSVAKVQFSPKTRNIEKDIRTLERERVLYILL